MDLPLSLQGNEVYFPRVPSSLPSFHPYVPYLPLPGNSAHHFADCLLAPGLLRPGRHLFQEAFPGMVRGPNGIGTWSIAPQLGCQIHEAGAASPWPLVSALSGDVLGPRFNQHPIRSSCRVSSGVEHGSCLGLAILGCSLALGRMMKGVHISLKQRTPLL